MVHAEMGGTCILSLCTLPGSTRFNSLLQHHPHLESDGILQVEVWEPAGEIVANYMLLEKHPDLTF